MEAYPINAVEQLTGIKAHTLRIWEKRYKALIPHRTHSNIRYYDDAQLKKLLNISTLLKHGHKISALSVLNDDRLSELIVELFDSNNADAFDMHVNALVGHMLSFDERSFDKVFSNVIIKYGFYEAIIKVIYPFLRKTGLLWSTNSAAPSQEHFASHIIKRKLLTSIDGIPYAVHGDKKFLLFLPPNEYHEIGLLVADLLIRNKGGETIYLGQNVPYNSLEIAIEKTNATHLVTFFTAPKDVKAEAELLSRIATKYGLTLLVSSIMPVTQQYPNMYLMTDPDSLMLHI